MLWKQQPPHGCLEEHAKALTPEKIVTVFAIWAVGAIIALIAFVAERIVKYYNRNGRFLS